MDFELIERLMRMLEQSSLNELDVTEGGMRIRLAKTRGGAAVAAELPPVTELSEATDTPRTQTIAAGMAGAFYRAPSPGADPFVQIGDLVREGQQLAIIEAMKTFNPVESDRDGIIVAILVEDGGSVEPGTALFDIGDA